MDYHPESFVEQCNGVMGRNFRSDWACHEFFGQSSVCNIFRARVGN